MDKMIDNSQRRAPLMFCAYWKEKNINGEEVATRFTLQTDWKEQPQRSK